MPNSAVSMGAIAGRMTSVLREHPEIVLPVLAADALAFLVMHVQHALHDPLFQYFLVKQSVLGSTPERFVLTTENMAGAAIVAGPLLLAAYFVMAYLYAAALLVVATMMRSFRDDEPTTVQDAIALVVAEPRRVLRFTVVGSGMALFLAAAAYAVIPILGEVPFIARHMGFDLGILVGSVLEIPFAFFIASPMLAFLRPVELGESRAMKRLAVFAGLLCIAAEASLSMFLQHVVPRSFFQHTTVAGVLTQQLFTSLVEALLLYVPLFVAWSLIAEGSDTIPIVS